jgi:hypothetical protein
MAAGSRLSTPNARTKLKPRDAPYYVELRRGVHVGYRHHKGKAGSWLMREFKTNAGSDGKGGYVKRRLGAADDTVPPDGVSVLTWEQAQQLALGAERPTVTKPGKYTGCRCRSSVFRYARVNLAAGRIHVDPAYRA